MNAHARRGAAKITGQSKLKVRLALWDAARNLLQHDDHDAVSGRLVLADEPASDGQGTIRTVTGLGLEPVMTRWNHVPTFIMDATLPDLAVLRAFYPTIEIVADIEARARHAHTRQVLGAPTSAKKLMQSEAERNLRMMRRAVLIRFLQAERMPTLVIAQQRVSNWLKASGLPAGIKFAHFNAVAGLDGFKDVRLVIVIGRTLPKIEDVEALAGAMTGLEVARVTETVTGKPRWYDKPTLAIRMADGCGRPVQGDRHPDPLAEALRWQICEAGLIQAIGRARAVNRTAATPVDIEIWSDVVLPVTVDDVVLWEDLNRGSEAHMLMDGIALESPSDMASCWPHVRATEEAAKQWRKRSTRCHNPIDILYRDATPCGFTYQHKGERQKWRKGRFDPAVLADPKTWLEARIGPLSGFELEVRAVDHTAGTGLRAAPPQPRRPPKEQRKAFHRDRPRAAGRSPPQTRNKLKSSNVAARQSR